MCRKILAMLKHQQFNDNKSENMALIVHKQQQFNKYDNEKK